MFDWDRFKNGEIAVHCDTEEKANDFLKECDSQGIAWADGDKTTEINCWVWYEKNTSYACSGGKSKLGFNFLEDHKHRGLEIIKWEIDIMKELTFKEVIANIKEGEVWECSRKDARIKKIRINNSLIVFDYGDTITEKQSAIRGTDTFKLKRKEYTFEEAFKAYEEGKEVESCFSGQKFRIYSWEDIFNAKEIKEKWYIND